MAPKQTVHHESQRRRHVWCFIMFLATTTSTHWQNDYGRSCHPAFFQSKCHLTAGWPTRMRCWNSHQQTHPYVHIQTRVKMSRPKWNIFITFKAHNRGNLRTFTSSTSLSTVELCFCKHGQQFPRRKQSTTHSYSKWCTVLCADLVTSLNIIQRR